MRSSSVSFLVLSVLTSAMSSTGCRTTRSEVPPPPNFARDGRKVGFGSSPKAGFMTDASTQVAPGIAAPGGDRTSVASRDGLRESPTATIPQGQPPKSGGLGKLFDGMTSSSAAKRDDAAQQAGFELGTPPAKPLDPPVSLPPPPLIPPPPATSDPSPAPSKAAGAVAPPALPQESALPPLLPEPAP